MSRLHRLLTAAAKAAEAAAAEASAAWPVGAQVIVRSQRFGHEPSEFMASVVGAVISVSMLGNDAYAYVSVNVRNHRTGKTSVRYPGIDVAGLPAVRIAYPVEEECAEAGICRTCGCTDTHACAGGCWWVEADLCSACAPQAGGAHG